MGRVRASKAAEIIAQFGGINPLAEGITKGTEGFMRGADLASIIASRKAQQAGAAEDRDLRRQKFDESLAQFQAGLVPTTETKTTANVFESGQDPTSVPIKPTESTRLVTPEVAKFLSPEEVSPDADFISFEQANVILGEKLFSKDVPTSIVRSMISAKASAASKGKETSNAFKALTKQLSGLNKERANLLKQINDPLSGIDLEESTGGSGPFGLFGKTKGPTPQATLLKERLDQLDADITRAEGQMSEISGVNVSSAAPGLTSQLAIPTLPGLPGEEGVDPDGFTVTRQP